MGTSPSVKKDEDLGGTARPSGDWLDFGNMSEYNGESSTPKLSEPSLGVPVWGLADVEEASFLKDFDFFGNEEDDTHCEAPTQSFLSPFPPSGLGDFNFTAPVELANQPSLFNNRKRRACSPPGTYNRRVGPPTYNQDSSPTPESSTHPAYRYPSGVLKKGVLPWDDNESSSRERRRQRIFSDRGDATKEIQRSISRINGRAREPIPLVPPPFVCPIFLSGNPMSKDRADDIIPVHSLRKQFKPFYMRFPPMTVVSQTLLVGHIRSLIAYHLGIGDHARVFVVPYPQSSTCYSLGPEPAKVIVSDYLLLRDARDEQFREKAEYDPGETVDQFKKSNFREIYQAGSSVRLFSRYRELKGNIKTLQEEGVAPNSELFFLHADKSKVKSRGTVHALLTREQHPSLCVPGARSDRLAGKTTHAHGTWEVAYCNRSKPDQAIQPTVSFRRPHDRSHNVDAIEIEDTRPYSTRLRPRYRHEAISRVGLKAPLRVVFRIDHSNNGQLWTEMGALKGKIHFPLLISDLRESVAVRYNCQADRVRLFNGGTELRHDHIRLTDLGIGLGNEIDYSILEGARPFTLIFLLWEDHVFGVDYPSGEEPTVGDIRQLAAKRLNISDANTLRLVITGGSLQCDSWSIRKVMKHVQDHTVRIWPSEYLVLRYRDDTHLIHFPKNDISSGRLTITWLRAQAGWILGKRLRAFDPDGIILFFDGGQLHDRFTGKYDVTAQMAGLKSGSEVCCILTNESDQHHYDLDLKEERRLFHIIPRRDCAVCGETKEVDDFPDHITQACDHEVSTCRDCLQSWIASSLESKFWDQIRCSECSEVLKHSDMKASASDDVFQKYDRLVTRAALSGNLDFRWCINPRCESGHIHTSGTSNPIFRCRSCGFKACAIHNIAWHEGETCEQFDIRTDPVKRKKAEEDASIKNIMETTKVCPGKGCGKRIYKHDGCDHMECSQCMYEFCWLCLADYETIRLRGNAAHKSECKHHTLNLML